MGKVSKLDKIRSSFLQTFWQSTFKRSLIGTWDLKRESFGQSGTGSDQTSSSSAPHQHFVSFSSALHQLFNSSSSILHQLLMKSSSSLNQVFINFSLALHQLLFSSSSALHQFFINSSLALHQLFISSSSILHQLFISSSSTLSLQLSSSLYLSSWYDGRHRPPFDYASYEGSGLYMGDFDADGRMNGRTKLFLQSDRPFKKPFLLKLQSNCMFFSHSVIIFIKIAIIVIATIIIIIKKNRSYAQNVVFDVQKRGPSCPNWGDGVGEYQVIWAMPKENVPFN